MFSVVDLHLFACILHTFMNEDKDIMNVIFTGVLYILYIGIYLFTCFLLLYLNIMHIHVCMFTWAGNLAITLAYASSVPHNYL